MGNSPHRSIIKGTLHPEFLETSTNKLKMFTALTVPFVISVVILELNARDWYSHTTLGDTVVNYHVFVAPTIQVLSSILAGLQLTVVFTILECSRRILITQQNIALNKLRLWSVLSSGSPNIT